MIMEGVVKEKHYVYHVSTAAYVKMCLHAIKHPACCVLGLLVGKKKTEKERSTGEERTLVEVVDAMPVMHRHTTLAPMMELALRQVDEEARRNGICIVGCYTAPEIMHVRALLEDGKKKDEDEEKIANSTMALADKIHATCNGACVLQVRADTHTHTLEGFFFFFFPRLLFLCVYVYVCACACVKIDRERL